jgi:hypothetical protein
MSYGTLTDTPCIHSLDDVRAVANFLATMPAHVESTVAGLTEAQIRFKRDDRTFSCAENIHHLRDIEVEGYAVRLRRILTEETPLLADIDGGRLAVERRYNQQPIGPAIAAFAAARRANLEIVRGLRESDLERDADMEGVGRITLAQLLQMWREHDAGHRRDFEELFRALGRA